MLFCTNNAAWKNIVLSCVIFLYEKMKNCSTQSFKECLFFVLFLFCFLLLSNNTLHVMSYAYICYWNTIQYKYIIQITLYTVVSKVKCIILIILPKTPRKIGKYFPFANSNLCEYFFDHLRYFLTFLLPVFIKK